MQVLDDALSPLGRGALYLFRDCPNPDVPRHGAGVYTIWHQDGRFIYVGMSGRAITKDTAIRKHALRDLHPPTKPRERTPERRSVLRLRSRSPRSPDAVAVGHCVDRRGRASNGRFRPPF